MKNLFCIILFFVFCAFISQTPETKNVKVTLHLDDYISSEEQWVYMFGFKSWVSGNEWIIFDSAKIDKGQSKVNMHSYIPYEMDHYLLFSRLGPQNFSFIAEPNKHLEINLSATDGEAGGTKLIRGGNATNEDFLFRQQILDPLLAKIKEFNSLEPPAKDSIDHYEKLLAEQSIEFIKNTSHATNAYDNFLALRMRSSEVVGYDRLEELKLYIQNKFYDNHSIINLGMPGPPPSEESKRFSARLNQIHEGRESIAPQDTIIGAQVSLSLPNMEGQYISTDSLTSDYLLVDFWASWCAPCRKESPYLKEALSKYDSSFSIYAVTLDSDLNACMQAIEKDGTEEFIHVKGILGGRFPCYAVRKLGVREIPANFLLDKNRRIVAKNLRGEELLQILGELIREN